MSAESKPDLQLEIGHLLLIDVVGYSKLLVNEQIELLQELNRVVRQTPSFCAAEGENKLIRLPTGDGMALVFFRSPEEPARCALEIHAALRAHPHIQVRMGVHSGPVTPVSDVNDRSNVAGAGINVAQRVMDCGDAGHILLSKHVADDLGQYRHWRSCLKDLGECEVKHGLRLSLVNLCKDGFGNPEVPQKLRRRKWKHADPGSVRPVRPPMWTKAGLFCASGLATIILLAIVSLFFRHSPPPPVASLPAKSIAVLPFDNFSDDNRNSHITEAVQDEILTDLAKVADLKVISRTSVAQYKDAAHRNLREIGKELGVAHVVEGSVQCLGSRVRVTAQLIDTRTDTHLWAERYDGDLADVFDLESEISEKIVAQLKSRLSPREKAAIEERPTKDLAAYDFYLRGKSRIAKAVFDSMPNESLNEAVQLLNQAVAQDPVFPLAYYELAHAHDQIYLYGEDHSPARLALADQAIQALIRLRPESGEAHLALAKHYYWGYLDFDKARTELAAARRALPNDPWPPLLAGYIDRRQGLWPESTRNLEEALQLDPRNPLILHQLSLSYQCLRRYDDMRAILDRALSLNPRDVQTRLSQAGIELDVRADITPLRTAIQQIIGEDPRNGSEVSDVAITVARYDRNWVAANQAVSALPSDGCREEGLPFPRAWCEGLVARMHDEQAARSIFLRGRADVENTLGRQPDYPEALCVLAVFDAALGRRDEAIREGKRAVELLPVKKDSINGALLIKYLALIYAWCGEKDHATEQLTKAASLPGYLSYGQLRLDPLWDPLRGDPRFEKVVASLAPQ